MSRPHQHDGRSYGRAFAIGVGLYLAFVTVEVIFGLAAHSCRLAPADVV